jgi:hypothetical protein
MNGSFGQVIEVAKPLPEFEPVVWSCHVEVRKGSKNGTVSYTPNFGYETGDKRIGDLVRGCLSDIRLPNIAGELPAK